MKPHKIDAEDFDGEKIVNRLSSSISNKKSLDMVTYLSRYSVETVFCVTVNRGTAKENSTAYETLQGAIFIYNLAEA